MSNDVVPDVIVDVQSVANAIVKLGWLLIEDHGRRWLMVGAHRGYTRSATDDQWWFGERLNPRHVQELTQVTSPYMVTALDAWESTHIEVDTDPTAPQGLVRTPFDSPTPFLHDLRSALISTQGTAS